ncbi:Thioredoxin domain-containing protein [Cephalotus follicularis]|uniref:Thioredoxin domain-containing protein n=1 Tax=Cephalotus follicularis TaxID=3775 RepID=A0A1Q3CUC1_CEPFO|nr:Thioredoxin domain-containing protein [Cephalotus follicularis]
MKGISIYRSLATRRYTSSSSSFRCIATLASKQGIMSSSSPKFSIPKMPLSNHCYGKHYPFQQFRRTLVFNYEAEAEADKVKDPPNLLVIKTEEEFNSSLNKVKGESLPAMFYFTAGWCKPCRIFSPVISVLSGRYPHVTVYRIDIDQEGLQDALYNVNVASVPTLHFFLNGEKVDEVNGADILRLKENMEKFYPSNV